MNETSVYLTWQYLMFLAPAAAAGFLLLLSALHIGGHHGGHGHHTLGEGHHPVHGHAEQAGETTGIGSSGTKGDGRADVSGAGAAVHMPQASTVLLAVLGIRRAPLPLLLELFALCWGVAGYCAIQTLAPANSVPTGMPLLAVLGIALLGGFVGSRFCAEVVARVVPRDETYIVPRNRLLGLTGEVVYAVSGTAGRIHIYDGFGTMHDESCRVPADHPGIAKGHFAQIVDLDAGGYLIVDETPLTATASAAPGNAFSRASSGHAILPDSHCLHLEAQESEPSAAAPSCVPEGSPLRSTRDSRRLAWVLGACGLTAILWIIGLTLHGNNLHDWLTTQVDSLGVTTFLMTVSSIGAAVYEWRGRKH